MLERSQERLAQAEYASDFLEFFYELATSAQDPELRRAARAAGRSFGRRFLEGLATATDADELTDQIGVLALLPAFGLKSTELTHRTAEAWPRFELRDRLEVVPGELCRNPDRLCDAVIAVHFAARAGLASRVQLRWILSQAARYDYRPPAELDEDRKLFQDNLVTHVIYVISDYGRLSLAKLPMRRERGYLRRGLPRLMIEGDVELVSEFVDSQRILGLSDKTPSLARALHWLLRHQDLTGGFRGRDTDSYYDRYHSTWTAINAIRRFRFEGQGPRWPWRGQPAVSEKG